MRIFLKDHQVELIRCCLQRCKTVLEGKNLDGNTDTLAMAAKYTCAQIDDTLKALNEAEGK